MKLPPEDIELFYKLYPALLFFVNQQHRVCDVSSAEELIDLPAKDRLAIRQVLYQHQELIDQFLECNPAQFSAEELEIVAGWKDAVVGEFCLLRQLKKHAIFLSLTGEVKAYGVLAIFDLFDELLPFTPIFVETVLLPFRGKIIYDGLLESQNLHFGGGIRRRFDDDYSRAKARHGLITSLEVTTTSEKDQQEDEDSWLLKYYLKSRARQEEYWDEVQNLRGKSAKNQVLYYQEMGKYYAKRYGKRLRERGIERGWFGILEDTIIGSGSSEKEALSNITGILSEEQVPYVYLFQLRAKKSSH